MQKENTLTNIILIILSFLCIVMCLICEIKHLNINSIATLTVCSLIFIFNLIIFIKKFKKNKK